MDDKESDEFRRPRDEYWQVKYKLRTIDDWRKEVNADRERMEKRIRELEDFKLTVTSTHKAMVKWMAIASTCLQLLELVFGAYTF